MYSKTYIAAFVSFLALLAQIFKVELPFKNEEIEQAVIIIAGIVGFVLTLYRRFKQGDIKWFGTYDQSKQTQAPLSESD
jgi:hypothetical protein